MTDAQQKKEANVSKPKVKNEHLTRVLMQYPLVFLGNRDIPDFYELNKSEELIPFEKEIIKHIVEFAIKRNEMKQKHPTPKTISFKITVLGTEFSAENVNIDTEKKMIERTYKCNKPSCYEILSAVIIQMLLDAGVDELYFCDCKINELDAHLSLIAPLRSAVEKLAQWICYNERNVSSEFRKFFPNSVSVNMFNPTKITYSELTTGSNKWEIELIGIIESEFNKEFNTSTSPLYHEEIEKKLKKTSRKYLLYSYLMNKEVKYDKRTVAFLRTNCVIRIKWAKNGNHKIDIDLKAPILNVIHNLKSRLKFLSQNKEFTYSDCLFLLGNIAHLAANKQHYAVLDDTFYNDIENKLILERRIINEMLKSLESVNDESGIIKTVNKVKPVKVAFLYKDYRLVFEGAFQAIEFSRNHTNIDDIVSFIIDGTNFEGDTKTEEKNHLNLKYNSFIIYHTALLYFLDMYNRESVLEKLLETAKDFTVNKRIQQIKAIYLLSYYLVDGLPIPSALRKKIFIATFGTSMYDFQFREIWRLFKTEKSSEFKSGSTTNYFIELAKNTFFDACQITEDGYAKSEPYFNFWIGFMEGLRAKSDSAKAFLIKSSRLQRKIWECNLDKINIKKYVYDILQNLGETLVTFRKHMQRSDSNILYYVYSAHILFYSLADLANMHRKQEDVLNVLENAKKIDDLVECCVLCDYLTRKFNRCYDQGEYENMYLLCGAFRLVCAYSLPHTKKYSLSGEVKEKYTEWLEKESSLRYIALLYRLLSYTDYPIEQIKSYLKQFQSEDVQDYFLEYDHITLDTSFLDAPQKL